MYNKKVLKKAVDQLDKAKAPGKPKDIIVDPAGQWKFPGQNTRIPNNQITMKGVDYPVIGVANTGQLQMMYPGAEYTFPGANYVDEYPQMQNGGDISLEGYNEKSPWLGEEYQDLGATMTKGNFNISAGNYFPTKIQQPTGMINPYVNVGYDFNKNRSLSFEATPGYTGLTFTKSFQEGGEEDGMNGMMKARLAYANEFKNPAAKRMIVIPDNPYQFEDGNTGTHFMASMDNYAVPQIQEQDGQLILGDYGPDSNEAMRFDTPEDAEYFAEHYKDVAPGFIEADLTPEEIEEYAKGGFIIEDVSVPSLTKLNKFIN